MTKRQDYKVTARQGKSEQTMMMHQMSDIWATLHETIAQCDLVLPDYMLVQVLGGKAEQQVRVNFYDMQRLLVHTEQMQRTRNLSAVVVWQGRAFVYEEKYFAYYEQTTSFI